MLQKPVPTGTGFLSELVAGVRPYLVCYVIFVCREDSAFRRVGVSVRLLELDERCRVGVGYLHAISGD